MHSVTYETPKSEQSPAVRKYRDLLQTVRETGAAPASSPIAADSEPGTYYVRVLPDGSEVYGYSPGSWAPNPAVFGEWGVATGEAPSVATYWSNVAALTHEARRAVG